MVIGNYLPKVKQNNTIGIRVDVYKRQSKRIQEMHRRVCQIKASEKTEVKYMQSWEERIMIKQEGIAEGKMCIRDRVISVRERLVKLLMK